MKNIDKKKTELTWAGNIPKIKQGEYSDGMPYNEVNYLCSKLILKPDRFVSRRKMFSFGKLVKASADRCNVKFTRWKYKDVPFKLREVIFFDTPDFRLYNNAFVMRRRVSYVDGFPVTDPEIVLKFRHPDLQKTAETDIRPHIEGDYRIKFKVQALPLKDKLGGIRMLYSNNVQFPRSRVSETDALSMDVISKVFPVLGELQKISGEKVQLVNDTIIEEVLQDIGLLDFGQGIVAKANISIWRNVGEHRPLIAEFAFQFKFNSRDKMKIRAMKRLEAFFMDLQFEAADWISLDATKTGVVYRILGNKPTSHE
jgi:hypothetical protein